MLVELPNVDLKIVYRFDWRKCCEFVNFKKQKFICMLRYLLLLYLNIFIQKYAVVVVIWCFDCFCIDSRSEAEASNDCKC